MLTFARTVIKTVTLFAQKINSKQIQIFNSTELCSQQLTTHTDEVRNISQHITFFTVRGFGPHPNHCR
jgi:hypothetical protein